jgi:hypothetical protein
MLQIGGKNFSPRFPLDIRKAGRGHGLEFLIGASERHTGLLSQV